MRYTRWALGAGWLVAVAVLASVAWGPLRIGCEEMSETPPPVAIVATVDGKAITWDDLEFWVLMAQAQQGIRYEGDAGERSLAELRAQALERIIDRILVAREAERRGYVADPARVQKTMDDLRGRIPERTTLARRLASGAFKAQVEALARDSAVGEPFLADLRKGTTVAPEEIEAFYREQAENFRVPGTTLVDEISFEDRRAAEEALKRLRAGEAFEAVGARYGGVQRVLIIPGRTEPVRERAAADLAVGQTSDIVAAPDALLILKVVTRNPARALPLEQVREQIERTLRAQKDRKVLVGLIKELRGKAAITRHLPPAATPAASPSPAGGPSPQPTTTP